MLKQSTLRVGIGGPVGSGKTALLLHLCRAMRAQYNLAVVTNDIYTREDAEFLTRHQALASNRIIGVETGGCPHTAIREDASMNLAAVDDLCDELGDLDLVFIESGGDNLSATFSPELSDLTIYVIDVAARGQDSPEGRARHHPIGPAGDQQDRPGPARRRVARGDGARRSEDARGAPVRLHQPQVRGRARHRGRAHPAPRHARSARRRSEHGSGGGSIDSYRAVPIPARRGFPLRGGARIC